MGSAFFVAWMLVKTQGWVYAFFFDSLMFCLTIKKQKIIFAQQYPGLTCLPETEDEADAANKAMKLVDSEEAKPDSKQGALIIAQGSGARVHPAPQTMTAQAPLVAMQAHAVQMVPTMQAAMNTGMRIVQPTPNLMYNPQQQQMIKQQVREKHDEGVPQDTAQLFNQRINSR